VQLLMWHPELAERTCTQCAVYRYRDDGSVVKDKATGEPLKRNPSERLPCIACPKCRGVRQASPEIGRQCDLSRKNRLTLRRFWERGKGDEITRRNFGIIREALADHRASLQRVTLHTLTILASARRW